MASRQQGKSLLKVKVPLKDYAWSMYGIFLLLLFCFLLFFYNGTIFSLSMLITEIKED